MIKHIDGGLDTTGIPVLIDVDGRVLVRLVPGVGLVGNERYIAKSDRSS